MERAARTMWLRRSRITAQCIAFIGAGVGAAVAFFLSGSFWLILIGQCLDVWPQTFSFCIRFTFSDIARLSTARFATHRIRELLLI